jgi:hypothetical protein
MEQLITRREQQMQARYESRLTQPALADRLMTLKALRTQEGYMADIRQEEDGSWLWWSTAPSAVRPGLSGLLPQRAGAVSPLLAPAGVEREQYLLRGSAAASIASGRSPERAERQKQQSRRRDACFVAFGRALVPARRCR